jgi:hypothetical protein
METQTRNQIAKYWKYDGNHPDGKDRDRANSYKYNAGLVGYVAYMKEVGGAEPFIPNEMMEQIKVRHAKGDDFGHEVEVSAPSEVWDVCRESWREMLLDMGYNPEHVDEIINAWSLAT